jgi:sulfate transport system ATP-binding protein
VRQELREWLRRLHELVHVTTIFVTHDQEEAMEVAEQIVVMDHARIEQVGAPRELYEEPANEFVMRFVGPVSEWDGELVRPHDIDILREPEAGTHEAMIQRVVHLGFEVKVLFALTDGQELSVQVTRAQANQLELEPGQIVYVRTDPSGTSVRRPSLGVVGQGEDRAGKAA